MAGYDATTLPRSISLARPLWDRVAALAARRASTTHRTAERLIEAGLTAIEEAEAEAERQ